MINEDSGNPSWPAFLTDLNFALKPQDEAEGPSGAGTKKRGTRPFVAIGVLYPWDEEHSFMHDLEYLFWVLFWICVHHNGPNEARRVTEFNRWYCDDDHDLSLSKLGAVTAEKAFFEAAEKDFAPYYRSLIPWVNRLRKVVFSGNEPWSAEDPALYIRMKDVLREAQRDPEVLAET